MEFFCDAPWMIRVLGMAFMATILRIAFADWLEP